jgi:Dolichyl-phosphate-mannose-protein mannosyltransferase
MPEDLTETRTPPLRRSIRRAFKDPNSYYFSCAVAIGCLVSLYRAVHIASLPYEVNFEEGPLARVAQALTLGASLYSIPNGPPYELSPYGPIAYYLIALPIRLFGISFTPPRLLIVVLGVACAVMIALLLRHWTGSLWTGAVFGAVFLTMPTVLQWLPVLRVDLIGLMFSLLGIYVFTAWKRWYVSIAFFVAALLCKFLFLSAPAACFLALLLKRDWKRAIQFAGSYVALAGAIVLYWQCQSHGWFAFHTLWIQAHHRFRPFFAVLSVFKELRDNVVLLLVIVLAVMLSSHHSYQLRRDAVVPAIYFVTSFFIMFARGKSGADSNYFLEWEAALCLCAGLAYNFLRGESQRLGPRLPRVVLPLLLACAALGSVFWTIHHRDNLKLASLKQCGDAYHFVNEHPGDRVLSDNVGAAFMARKHPLVSDPFMWGQEVIGGRWPDTQILDLIRSRQIDLIVLSEKLEELKDDPSNRWPPSVLDAISRNYTLTKTYACTEAEAAYLPATR